MGGPPAPCLCDQTSHLSSQPEPPPLPLLKPPEVDVDPSSVSQSTVGGSPFLPRLWGCRQRMASQAGQAVTGDGDTGHVSAPSLHRGCPGHLELHHSPDPPACPPVVLGPSGLPAPVSCSSSPRTPAGPSSTEQRASCTADRLLQGPRGCVCAPSLRRCWGTGVHRCRLACSPGGSDHGPSPSRWGEGPALGSPRGCVPLGVPRQPAERLCATRQSWLMSGQPPPLFLPHRPSHEASGLPGSGAPLPGDLGRTFHTPPWLGSASCEMWGFPACPSCSGLFPGPQVGTWPRGLAMLAEPSVCPGSWAI